MGCKLQGRLAPGERNNTEWQRLDKQRQQRHRERKRISRLRKDRWGGLFPGRNEQRYRHHEFHHRGQQSVYVLVLGQLRRGRHHDLSRTRWFRKWVECQSNSELEVHAL